MTSSNFIVAALMVAIFWLWLGWNEAERKVDDAVARELTEEMMRDIEKRRDDIRKDLLNGGEGDLSPYMRNAGERLWGGN